MTQEALAALLGVSFATVNRWERGRSRGPHGIVLIMLKELEVAAARDPAFDQRLAEWASRGMAYMMWRLFTEASEHNYH